LACMVRARIPFHEGWSKCVGAAFHKLRLKKRIDQLLWEYLRVRMDTQIPDIDPSIPVGEPSQIHAMTLGKVLGQGAFGKVFEVRKDDNCDAPMDEVVKCVSKGARNSIDAIKDLKNQIVAMRHLSKGVWEHPNITKLLGVMHSRTHIFLRMEYGGPEDLCTRLNSRDGKHSEVRELPLHKVLSVISQCIGAVAHLHMQPSIAHRDIKPDNIIMSETADLIMIKLADFGLSKVVSGQSISRSVAGTLPYMAPEMVLNGRCDVFSADIWSMGIVCLDVLCFVKFVEREIFRNQPGVKNEETGRKKNRFVEAVFNYFSAPNCIEGVIGMRTRPELQDMAVKSSEMLQGMLNVSTTERWSAKDLIACVSALQVHLQPPVPLPLGE